MRFASALGAAGVVLALSLPAQAQQDGGTLWAKGGCFNCHGPLAEGGGDDAFPVGPSLRRSKLDRNLMLETISCGRPGTPMPFNLAGAYTETQCYGVPLGKPSEVSHGADLTAEQIHTLVDFLMEHVVGVRKTTRENCAVFYGGNMNARACLEY